MTRISALLAATSVAALLGFSAWYVMDSRANDPFAACRNGQIAGGAIGGPFTLTDQTGAEVTEAQVLKTPALVYFGYASCPDVCPLDNTRNAEAADILEERGLEVTPVFITIDPARDRQEVMADYAANMHPRMIALTGTEAQVRAAADAYKVYYKKREGEDPEFYLMDHTTQTYLMLPGTGYADFYRRETTAEDMANSVACFLGES